MGNLNNSKNTFYHLGEYTVQVDETIDELLRENIIEKIWSKDFRVWDNNPDEIINRLGWLESPEIMQGRLNEINNFLEDVKKLNIKKVLLLGMGGSSLAPEVFSKTFRISEGYLDVAILDSTNPDIINYYSKNLKPDDTLYIVSTKSGSTVETVSFMKYFYNLVEKQLGKSSVSSHFVAITDPGSGLEKVANELRFRKIFLNDPNIGGRYSALSFFGLVPAALLGVNLHLLLERANEVKNESKVAVKEQIFRNRSAVLGCIIGQMAVKGKDKLSLILSPGLKSFGAWIEQLIAESTGKNGKGILPIDSEDILDPVYYSNDRIFIFIRLKDDNSQNDLVIRLKSSGHPLIEIVLNDLYDLGGEFFKWEYATAVAGWKLGIHPFNQPDVESAKIQAKNMIKTFKEIGKIPELGVSYKQGNIEVYESENVNSLHDVLNNFLNISEGAGINGRYNYVALQAYIPPTEENIMALSNLKLRILKKYKIATTIGFGPRFLHSTGQLHKGDSGNGIFIQLLSKTVNDIPVPDETGFSKSSISFGVLINSQALGDRKALITNSRKVLTIGLGDKVVESIYTLAELLK
ncbi:glucose-6-phosphate isomerase [Bacteroidota bacterium]